MDSFIIVSYLLKISQQFASKPGNSFLCSISLVFPPNTHTHAPSLVAALGHDNGRRELLGPPVSMKNLTGPLHMVISEVLPPHSWLAVFPGLQGFGCFASISHFARMYLQINIFLSIHKKNKSIH